MANMEKPGRQNQEKVDTKRRNFLKILGIGAAGAAVGVIGKKGYETMLVSDKEEEKNRENQISTTDPVRQELSDDEIIGREASVNGPQHELSDDEIIGREPGTNPPRHELSDDEIIGRDVDKK